MRPPASDRGATYLDHVRSQVPALPAPPATREGWERRLADVRKGLERSLGRMPAEDCDLDPEVLGTTVRDGVAIERLTFQSRPGVRVTANLYRPEVLAVKAAAVLAVHGHWTWARMDPHVQARCLGLAKLGYVALAVDAFGAGERAVEPGPGTYHGGLLGASLWPAGVPLLGLQVYDNRRAVDYLISRPEVDADRIAITGASGGGNQSLYAGATDSRLKGVVPVCGIGTLRSYIGLGCCVCEVLVGGLTYASTGDLLALMAPRALLVINATQDSIQFSVGEALKSVDYARGRYRVLGAEAKIRHLAVESGHDYNQPMREAMYGWLDRWLREKGDGSPVAEPAVTPLEPSALRCYPDGRSRPRTIVTIPEFAFREGRARLEALPPAADHRPRFEADSLHMRSVLTDDILGPSPRPVPLDLKIGQEEEGFEKSLEITTESGLCLKGRFLGTTAGRIVRGPALLLRPEGIASADDPLVRDLRTGGAPRHVISVELRATGSGKPEGAGIQGASDHNEAEWALWMGRPLLGQWSWDALRWIEAIEGFATRDEPPPVLVGVGPFSLVALIAAAFHPTVRVATVGGPVSFVGEGPWAKWNLGVIAPNILDVGDVGHLASLVAPRGLAITRGVEPDGRAASKDRFREAYAPTRTVYKALRAESHLSLSPSENLAALLATWED